MHETKYDMHGLKYEFIVNYDLWFIRHSLGEDNV